MKRNFERYCTEPENIENYEKAAADTFKGWDCHHRLETHNSDGESRLVDITVDELKALDVYYNRPASELIFLTSSEHIILHQKGKHHSEEAKKKIGAAKKGEKNPNYGKHLSEETRKKLRETMKGKPVSEETRKKLREAAKGNTNTQGKHWYNDGKINVMSKECPEGFVPGMLR